MLHHGRPAVLLGTTLAAALWLLSGCGETGTVARSAADPPARFRPHPPRTVLSGTRIKIALGGELSSETASAGDAWHGTVTGYVTTLRGSVIPAGSPVDGIVACAVPARRGARALLELAVRSIHVDGRDQTIAASAEPVLAGSPTQRLLGVPGEGARMGPVAADSAFAGRGYVLAVGVSPGAAAGAKRHAVVLSDGTVLRFTVKQTVAMR